VTTGLDEERRAVFNAMSPAELTAVLSTVLRESADWNRELDGFQRGQLKSASSIGRHLTAELHGGPPVATRFRTDLRAVLQTVPDGPADTPWITAARALAAALEAGEGEDGDRVAVLGGPVADLLAACRACSEERATRLAGEVRVLLRDLVDAEIAVLAAPAPAAPRPATSHPGGAG
jgi:hypothetical protein